MQCTRRTLFAATLSFVALLFLASGPSLVRADQVKLSSTIGPIDAGIVPLLAKTYEAKTGTTIVYEGAGTGATLKKAQTGSFDMVMVHARALEDEFVAQGYGRDRRDVMYNDFVILGPPEDPAGVKGMRVAVDAFRKIAAAGALCHPRGQVGYARQGDGGVEGKRRGTVRHWYETFAEGSKGNKVTTRRRRPQGLRAHGSGHLPDLEEGDRPGAAGRGTNC